VKEQFRYKAWEPPQFQTLNMMINRGSMADPVAVALSRARNTATTIENRSIITTFTQDRIDEYLVEIHKKYSIPVACIVFVFIGAPLGIMARRGTFGIAATFSLGFFLLYWSCLIGGEKLADRGIIAPWIGMWMANIFIGVLGIYLTIRVAQESPAIQWSSFRRFIPKSLRTPELPDTSVDIEN
jgi:lipopolysaccharide export system permease protein